MKYQVGDKFEVQGIVCEVRWVNQDKAWVAPLEDWLFVNNNAENGHSMALTYCIFEVLNEKGLDSKGNKVHFIKNIECQAV